MVTVLCERLVRTLPAVPEGRLGALAADWAERAEPATVEDVRAWLAAARRLCGPGDRGLDRPDAVLDGGAAGDIVPDTPPSRQVHLERGHLESEEQLIAYAPASPEFLAEIFGPDGP